MPAPLVLPAPSPPAPSTTQGSTFKHVTVCTTIKQDVEFIKVVYQKAEAQVVASNSPEAIVSTGAGLFLCETSDDTPPIAKPVLHELVKSFCPLIFVGARTIEWRPSWWSNVEPLTRSWNVRAIPFFVGSGDRLWARKHKRKKGDVVHTHHTLWIVMLCRQPFATGTVPALMATNLPSRSTWLKALMLLLGPGKLRPIDESRESLARLGLAYMPHPNRTPEEIYNTLTAIIVDCSRWCPRLINTTLIPIKTMATRLATSTEDRDPTPHRNHETEMRMWLTARPVTTETLRSMDAEYLEALKLPRCRGISRSRKPRSSRPSGRRRRPSWSPKLPH